MNDELRERVKETLATYGQDVHPHAQILEVTPPTEGTSAGVVMLERITAEKPDYCVHGYAECVRCRRMCFLGSETSRIVVEGKAFPLCLECGAEIIPSDTHPIERAEDHRRADGPHD